MNKKLLGIAAVALLGVSAAFAATTSTVYFTASGTLTKVVKALDGIDETDDNPSGNTHSDDEHAIGVSKVETSIDSSACLAERKFKGEVVTTGEVCTVQYSKVGRVETGKSGTTISEPPYIYKELILSNLEFSKAGDYILIPFYIYNAESYECIFNKACPYNNALTSNQGGQASDNTHYYYEHNTGNGFTSNDTLKKYFNIRLGNTKSAVKEKNVGATESTDSGKTYTYLINAGGFAPNFTTGSSTLLYLYIELIADYTESTSLSFSNQTIKIPAFTKR